MYKKIINKIKPKLEKTVEYFKSELTSLQIGRATPGLIENLEVEAYNQKMILRDLASIQSQDSRMIIIRPWDKAIIKNIESAVRKSSLGLSPIVDEDFIRLMIPPLSEERRKEIAKILNEKVEECRISIRRNREEIWREIQDMKQAKELTEDDKFKSKNELQKIVDEFNKKVDDIKKKKEEEIMTV